MLETFYHRANRLETSFNAPLLVNATGIKCLNCNESRTLFGLRNNFIELIWGISGVGEVELYDRKFRIKSNDVFYYMPHEVHKLKGVSDEWQFRYLSFEGPLAASIMLSYQYPRYQHGQEYPAELFEKIENGISDSDPLQARLIAVYVLEILAYMSNPAAEEIHSEYVVKHCLAIIEKELSNPDLDVDMLAKEVNIHRATLTRLFKASEDITPGRFILNQRFAQAKVLLRGTNLPISEVAQRCGMYELCSFSRFIKRGTGLSPLDYRKANSEQIMQKYPKK